jgi:uncharacterized protein with HEPN domain
MKHALRIEDYLQHIAEAIDRITEYIQGIDDAAALERDHKIQDAVIRNIEIIGEAANKFRNSRWTSLPPTFRCRGVKSGACVTG